MFELEHLVQKLAQQPTDTPTQPPPNCVWHSATPTDKARQSHCGCPPPERPKHRTLEGCPIHWTRVPELPRDRPVPLMGDDGFGCLYRLEVHGVWWLVKFLPPFDGRLSITDPHGQVRVLASLDEAMRLIEVLDP